MSDVLLPLSTVKEYPVESFPFSRSYIREDWCQDHIGLHDHNFCSGSRFEVLTFPAGHTKSETLHSLINSPLLKVPSGFCYFCYDDQTTLCCSLTGHCEQRLSWNQTCCHLHFLALLQSAGPRARICSEVSVLGVFFRYIPLLTATLASHRRRRGLSFVLWTDIQLPTCIQVMIFLQCLPFGHFSGEWHKRLVAWSSEWMSRVLRH